MKARVVQIGHSIGVILPQSVVKDLALEKGSTLTLQADPEHQALVLIKGTHLHLDPEFIRRVRVFSKRYQEDLRLLAQ